MYATKYHYDANREKYILKARIRINEIRQEVYKIKEENPCIDCGKYFPHFVMEFDHTSDNKLMPVSKLISSGNRKKIKEEIAKCELVCANCHRYRTHNRLAGSTTVSTLS